MYGYNLKGLLNLLGTSCVPFAPPYDIEYCIGYDDLE
jgi:hypothetical protein